MPTKNTGKKMVRLHPNILEKDGKRAFVVLPYEEFLQIQEELENYEDLKKLRAAKAKEADAPTTPLSKARKQLGA
jgi:PHD/YefM family antitoxin component YafN of YafNO toxin-antitoxin module